MTPAKVLLHYTKAVEDTQRGLDYLKKAPDTRSKGSNSDALCIDNVLSIAEGCLMQALENIRLLRISEEK